MLHYNPAHAPDPEQWLALDEHERIMLSEAHHRRARIRLPNATLHATFHAVVENQIAQGLESVVRAMARLKAQGLSRHDAVHAIGSVCAGHLFGELQSNDPAGAATIAARYDAAVERLSAQAWRDDDVS